MDSPPELEAKWKKLKSFVKRDFNKSPDINAILLLIGVQELGMGYRKFKKDEKINLMHIAICRLLEPFGYYEYDGRDKDGWPHYKNTDKLPALKAGEQAILMKQAIVKYFEEEA